MAAPRWAWSRRARRYRDTDTGRFLPAATIRGLRDRLIDQHQATIAAVAEGLGAGTLTLADWTRTMRAEIKTLAVGEYTFGRGGSNALQASDHGRIGALVKAQYRYLDDFVAQLARGELSPAQASARAALYGRAAAAAHGHGLAAAWDIKLPQVPGDGHTRCLTNCRCHLSIRETATAVEVEWIVDPLAEHCDDCLALGRAWQPLAFPKTEVA